jgi:hypothetical protein
LKNIQLLLQGIVRAQVNKGPLEFSNAFLASDKKAGYPLEKVTQLRLGFRNLLEYVRKRSCAYDNVMYRACYRALKLSKLHSPAEQVAYNEDLEEGE